MAKPAAKKAPAKKAAARAAKPEIFLALNVNAPGKTYPRNAEKYHVTVKTLQWANQKRIVPGDPDNSLLYKEISSRGGGKNSQMPPIASNEVDTEHVAMVRDWILSMKPLDEPDGSGEPEAEMEPEGEPNPSEPN